MVNVSQFTLNVSIWDLLVCLVLFLRGFGAMDTLRSCMQVSNNKMHLFCSLLSTQSAISYHATYETFQSFNVTNCCSVIKQRSLRAFTYSIQPIGSPYLLSICNLIAQSLQVLVISYDFSKFDQVRKKIRKK